MTRVRVSQRSGPLAQPGPNSALS